MADAERTANLTPRGSCRTRLRDNVDYLDVDAVSGEQDSDLEKFARLGGRP